MRTVNFNFPQEDFEALAKTLYALGCEDRAIEKAIGYLATWGFSYPFVDIHIADSKQAELTAYYRKNAEDSPIFVMGAVFNKQTKQYGFHS